MKRKREKRQWGELCEGNSPGAELQGMSSGDRHRRNVEGLIYEGMFGGLGV